MKIEGPALRLTVLVGEGDTWHHKPTRRTGSGPSCRSSTSWSAKGLVMTDPVEVVRYVGRDGER